MAIAKDTQHATTTLDELFASDENANERAHARLGREFGVRAFGVNAVRADTDKRVVGEHDELGPASDRHEELYLVVAGHADFTVDEEEIDAPAGTAVFVQPELKRSALAKEDGTTVLSIGGRAGKAYRLAPGPAMREFFQLHKAKDYEGARSVTLEVLGEFPGNAFILYNLACLDSLLGEPDAAFEHLGEALAKWPAYAETAREDEDFDAIRDDPRFEKLVPAA